MQLFGLEIVVDTTNDYSVLTMIDKHKFMCKQKDAHTYICKFFTLPSTPVFSTNTLDFTFVPFFQKNNFYLKIGVKNHSQMRAFAKNLYEGYNKHLKKLQIAKKWVIISYKTKKLPFINTKPIKGLKFPIQIDNEFYLKAIDSNGNPIDYDTQTGDVIEYFRLLRLFNKNALSIDRIDDFIHAYPKSIFVPDVLYLKIKLLDQNDQTDECIKLASEWIKKYSVNEHLPEVLLILAKNYANEGMIEDATYVYERLFTQYQDSKYAYEGMIYLADELYSAGDNKRAFELYKQAFSNTKDVEVASLAASRIAQRYLDQGNIKESIKYYSKLFEANKDFLLKDIQHAYELANQLAQHKAYKLAIKIGAALLEKLKPDNDLYEPLLYRLASWTYTQHDIKATQKYVDLYLKKFPYGDFLEQIKALKDKILFQIDDANATIMLQRYDTILKKYDGDIAKKALQKKINLLFKLHRYKDILQIAKKTPDINKTIVVTSAKDIVIHDLKTHNCTEAINYYKEYNITLERKFDDSLYHCAYKVRAFDIASVVCNHYLLDPDDKVVLKWLKNKAYIYQAQNNYEKLALIIDDICSLQKSNCYDWRYKQFFAYYHLNKPKEFLALAAKLSKIDNIKNIDIFTKVVLYAISTKNTLLEYTYAKKILSLEQKYHTYIQSPFIDFAFVNAAKKLKKPKEAIKVLQHLVTLDIPQEAKARAYYMLASLTADIKYLKQCIKLKKSKTWMPLCKEALEVYK